MQTILGANGIIGVNIAKTLPQFINQIRLVSRNPKKVNDTDELAVADLLNAQQVSDAVKGSEIVYLTAGLPYKASVWEQQWPVVMKNTIDACKTNGAKLVFFDNLYLYGRVNGVMTEETPFAATSRKGKVRATIATMILNEIKQGTLTAMICRAPEFYGPRPTLSGVNSTVFENIAKGKKPQWLINDERKRTFIFTPDAAKATALIANSPNTWNQTWHLPVDDSYPNGKQFMQMVSEAAGKPIPYSVMSKTFVKIGGLFNPFAKEIIELMYQWEQDYIFSSEKFIAAFPQFKITSYRDGIAQTLASFK